MKLNNFQEFEVNLSEETKGFFTYQHVFLPILDSIQKSMALVYIQPLKLQAELYVRENTEVDTGNCI